MKNVLNNNYTNNIKNIPKQIINKYNTYNPYLKILLLIIILIILLFIILIIYFCMTLIKKKELLFMTEINNFDPHNSKYIYLYNDKDYISEQIMKNNKRMIYTYSCWIYIDEWNYKYGYWKHIFHRGNKPIFDKNGIMIPNKEECPGLYISPKINTLVCNFKTLDIKDEKIEIDIDLNKWINILVTINVNNFCLYKNGKLEVSKYIDPFQLNYNNTYINYGGGFSGNMAYLSFNDIELKPNEIYKKYITEKKIFDLYTQFIIKEKILDNN